MSSTKRDQNETESRVDFVEIPINTDSDGESERSWLAAQEETTPLAPQLESGRTERMNLVKTSELIRGLGQKRQIIEKRGRDAVQCSVGRPRDAADADGGGEMTPSGGDAPTASPLLPSSPALRPMSTLPASTSETATSASLSVQRFFKKIWGTKSETGNLVADSYMHSRKNTQGDAANKKRNRNSSRVAPAEDDNTELSEDIIDDRSDNGGISNCSSDVFRPCSSHSLISSSSLQVERDLEPEVALSTVSVACRICQLNSEETEEELEETRCHCKGTLQFAHKSCVEKWIQTQRSTNCEICKGPLVEAGTAAERRESTQNATILDRVTNRLLMNMGVTNMRLTAVELQQVRRIVGRQIQRAILNVAVCTLTVSIVITCYVIVMTTHLEIGVPLLCALVLVTAACKERLNQLDLEED